MAGPGSDPTNSFSAFLRSARREARADAAGAVATGSAAAPQGGGGAGDPMLAVLRALAAGGEPRGVPALLEETGLQFNLLVEVVAKLEGLRLIRRTDDADRALFDVTRDGQAVLASAGG